MLADATKDAIRAAYARLKDGLPGFRPRASQGKMIAEVAKALASVTPTIPTTHQRPVPGAGRGSGMAGPSGLGERMASGPAVGDGGSPLSVMNRSG